ncbi:SDR family NAD(P)-dependent oxidoreductase [Neiella marina]|uniref:SDR family NAD(P)-dependent oxidoreductase n=1 Tax=Neiella holothuriorum TaxID=2870530 RepID=A0ABS7EHW0_9GAMM|nr:SDR family NAD(P)-dependent oxidoreductase [Neiella holothuriorum]MBW8191926.1 SDR family NAD(P)-dependent oxidoreductase [Neiella holothuriorum]
MPLNKPQSRQLTVLITGATSGVGYQLTLDYLASGANVIAIGRNVAQLVDLQQLGADTICCDLTDERAVATSCLELARRYAAIDVLILNAGVCHYVDDGQLKTSVLQQTLDINVVAPVRLLENLSDLLSSSPDAKVAFIGSASVYLPFARAEFYGASKAALQYLAHVLHNTLAPREIKVTNVMLGFIDTPLTQKNDFDMPMLASTQAASAAIRAGVEKGKAEVHFPRLFCGVLRLIHKLPVSARLWLASKLNQPSRRSNGHQTPQHKDLSNL